MISPKSFLQLEDDIIKIIKDYKQATTFEKIGDAMKVAVQINKNLNANITHVIYIYKNTSVSGNL